MIKSFKHRGLERFFLTGSKGGIQPAHERKLKILLAQLNLAQEIENMDQPGWALHPFMGRSQVIGRSRSTVTGGLSSGSIKAMPKSSIMSTITEGGRHGDV